jgi:hypothetical protein
LTPARVDRSGDLVIAFAVGMLVDHCGPDGRVTHAVHQFAGSTISERTALAAQLRNSIDFVDVDAGRIEPEGGDGVGVPAA